MDCEWLFLRKDDKKTVKLTEEEIPTPGDGKFYNNISYVVRHVVNGRTTSALPLVIATEHS